MKQKIGSIPKIHQQKGTKNGSLFGPRKSFFHDFSFGSPCSESGGAFTALLPNRKKSGEMSLGRGFSQWIKGNPDWKRKPVLFFGPISAAFFEYISFDGNMPSLYSSDIVRDTGYTQFVEMIQTAATKSWMDRKPDVRLICIHGDIAKWPYPYENSPHTSGLIIVHPEWYGFSYRMWLGCDKIIMFVPNFQSFFFSMFFRSATSLRFINLLDLRGLTIATDVETNEVALVFDWVVATKVFHVFFWRRCWLSHFNSTIMKYPFLQDQCQFTFKRCFLLFFPIISK